MGHGITESVWVWQRKNSPDSFIQSWTIKRKNLDPPQKTYKDEKIRADLSLISGLEDWEFAVQFYCVKDCRILCVPPHQQFNAFCLPLKLQDSLAFATQLYRATLSNDWSSIGFDYRTLDRRTPGLKNKSPEQNRYLEMKHKREKTSHQRYKLPNFPYL